MMDDPLLPPLCICQYYCTCSGFLGFYSKTFWEDQEVTNHVKSFV